jgi:RimJ/RimL family protein N-acetyltransferase/predicted CoA-binding protein
MSTYRLKNLLSPRSVALVGASSRQESVGRAILRNIKDAKFKGDFGLVNVRHAEIDGVATVASLGKLSFAPELVVITAPASSVAGLIDEAGQRGAAGAVIISAGLGHGAGQAGADRCGHSRDPRTGHQSVACGQGGRTRGRRARRDRSAERKFGGSGPANFAVRPYPSQWQRHLELRDGRRVFVRPIRPEDEPLIHEFLQHVTSRDLRLRFFAAMKEFAHEFIARLTQLDYARAMAFVAFDEATNEMMGAVRIHSDSIYETGEYAILLRSDLKGRGLGWALMQLIIEYARSEGLKAVWGDVLAENTIMLDMCRSLGFEVKHDPGEGDICNARLAL